MNPVQWGLLSTANIGRLMVTAARRSGTARFVAVASRDGDRSRRFAEDLGLEESFASYEALLACDRVDAVYIALPNSMHTEWAVKALQAGKHVLCEKPFALTAAEVRQAFDAAAEADFDKPKPIAQRTYHYLRSVGIGQDHQDGGEQS